MRKRLPFFYGGANAIRLPEDVDLLKVSTDGCRLAGRTVWHEVFFSIVSGLVASGTEKPCVGFSSPAA